VQDPVQYIRLQRGYVDTAQNALTLARNPDSIYYGPSVLVQLYDESAEQYHLLQRVNGEDFGLPKDSGIFAQSPNILYLLDEPLDRNSNYRLEVFNPKTGKRAIATTNLVAALQVNVPSDQYVVNWTGHEEELANFSWKHAAGAGIYDLKATFWFTNHYQSGQRETQSISWKIFTNQLAFNEPDEALLKYPYRTALFYQNVSGRIPANPNVVSRTADSVTFVMAAGGLELAMLISNQHVRDGLLSGMATPYYTNVKGGYGIFSSIYRDTATAALGATTLDSLRYSSRTAHLKFN
jgi:hypothetical protein